MRISDWSSDVCSSDLGDALGAFDQAVAGHQVGELGAVFGADLHDRAELLVEQHGAHVVGAVAAPAFKRDVEPEVRAERHLAKRERKSGVSGKRVSVRVDRGGRRVIKTKKKTKQ